MVAKEPLRWERKGEPSPRAAKGRVMSTIWLSFLLAIGFLILAAALSGKISGESTPERKSSAQKTSIPSFENAKTIFAVASNPPSKLLDALEKAYQKGARIRLVTSQKILVPYQVVIVPADRVARDAVLIDGVAWHPLPSKGNNKAVQSSLQTGKP